MNTSFWQSTTPEQNRCEPQIGSQINFQENKAMASPNYEESYRSFLKILNATAPYKHRYEVFRDFVTMSACSLHNTLHKEEKREAEYLKIISDYKSDDQKRFPKLLALLVQLLEDEPKDVLGQLYMELEIGNKNQGQFFTPNDVSELMARMVMGETIQQARSQEFITISEPACGAGGMVLALVKLFVLDKLNPAEKMWVQCIDVDRTAALMCYVQLSLWNVPAQVLVGNTLSLEMRESWYTPAHHLGLWNGKLRRQADQELQPAPKKVAVPSFDVAVNKEQLGFDF